MTHPPIPFCNNDANVYWIITQRQLIVKIKFQNKLASAKLIFTIA